MEIREEFNFSPLPKNPRGTRKFIEVSKELCRLHGRIPELSFVSAIKVKINVFVLDMGILHSREQIINVTSTTSGLKKINLFRRIIIPIGFKISVVINSKLFLVEITCINSSVEFRFTEIEIHDTPNYNQYTFGYGKTGEYNKIPYLAYTSCSGVQHNRSIIKPSVAIYCDMIQGLIYKSILIHDFCNNVSLLRINMAEFAWFLHWAEYDFVPEGLKTKKLKQPVFMEENKKVVLEEEEEEDETFTEDDGEILTEDDEILTEDDEKNDLED